MKTAIRYLLLVGLPLVGLGLVLWQGSGLVSDLPVTPPLPPSATGLMGSLLILLLQIAVILVTARGIGRLFRYIGQPQVVGEMLAGIMLGPSLLGALSPDVFLYLFPENGLTGLRVLSQTGLVLFMFLVGLELDPTLLRDRGRTALVTSHTSIVVPFFLGSLLALYLYSTSVATGASFIAFALFMGAAMSVTAFPVLARILRERNLMGTRLGAITIACAAVDDVTAWCILAGVVALVRASGMDSVLFTLIGSAVYIGLMIFAARPLLRWIDSHYTNRGRLSQDMFALILLLLLLSAWATEWLGIHALFGAFLLGTVMPRQRGLVRELTEKLESLTVVFLLPLFFAYAGLHTRIGLLNEAGLWMDCLLVILVAVVGKFGGSMLAARLTGLEWRESAALGVLMNTRGLMELVILTIGLELGVLSPALFTMLVIMALVTTLATTPVLERLYPARLARQESSGKEPRRQDLTVLIPVALPTSGPLLLGVAKAMAPAKNLKVYGLSLLRAEDEELFAPPDADERAGVAALAPLLDAGLKDHIQIEPLSFVSTNIGDDIVRVAHEKEVDLVLMGWHKPVLSQSVLGGAVYDVMSDVRADVAVLMTRIFRPWKRILVPFGGSYHDHAALRIAGRMAGNTDVEITILHVVKPGRPVDARLGFDEEAGPLQSKNVTLKVLEGEDPLELAVTEAQLGYDLVVIGASEEWGLQPTLFSARHERFARSCPASLLIVRRRSEPKAARAPEPVRT